MEQSKIQIHNKQAFEKCINTFMEFLTITYTAGNIIPAPRNWKPGSSLDGWDYKLDNILNNPNNNDSKLWTEYIKNYYENNIDKFILENSLMMYFKDNKVISFWGNSRPNKLSEATYTQWTTYFYNAKNCITARNKILCKEKFYPSNNSKIIVI